MTRDDSMRQGEGARAEVADPAQAAASWQRALDLLREWDSVWAETVIQMTENPRKSGVLPRKTVELISVALNTGSAAQHSETRRHIRAALSAGASHDEIFQVLKLSALRGFHSCAVAGLVLLEELSPSDLGKRPAAPPTPTADALRGAGRWDPAWDSLFYLDPGWTDEVLAARVGLEQSGVISPKLFALLSVAYYASQGPPQLSETRRHIKVAMRAGASAEELIEVLKLCFVQSVQACNVAVPILDEESAGT